MRTPKFLAALMCGFLGSASLGGAADYVISITKPSLLQHFFGNKVCRTWQQPLLLVTDTTRNGEIDDSISLLMYWALEMLGCVKIIGVVSIFGNGKSSTAEVHENLIVRIKELGLDSWSSLILRGPDRKAFEGMTAFDTILMQRIASIVNQYPSVVIAELGPMTVSARLLKHGLVDPGRIERILGVGGRSKGERFSTEKGLGSLFNFRDMNIAEDTGAAMYLVPYHASKLWMVTYQTGVGTREVSPHAVATYAPMLAEHAYQRAKVLGSVGYTNIPSWDTWTTSYFLQGGPEELGCKKTKAAMRYAEGFKDPMQLHLHTDKGHILTACHQAENT